MCSTVLTCPVVTHSYITLCCYSIGHTAFPDGMMLFQCARQMYMMTLR